MFTHNQVKIFYCFYIISVIDKYKQTNTYSNFLRQISGLARAPPPPMSSPCEIMPEPSEPFIGNYYNQPPFLYPPSIVPPPLPAQVSILTSSQR